MPDRSWYPGFREEWGHGNDHQTGWNKDWTESLLDVFSPAGIAASYSYLAQLETIPLAPCEAVLGCQAPAGFHLDMHGCASLLICEYHATEWMQIVLDGLNANGGMFCDECRLVYKSLAQFMEWRFV